VKQYAEKKRRVCTGESDVPSSETPPKTKKPKKGIEDSTTATPKTFEKVRVHSEFSTAAAKCKCWKRHFVYFK
jgi:hypothetical protein